MGFITLLDVLKNRTSVEKTDELVKTSASSVPEIVLSVTENVLHVFGQE